ncbi:MAG: hypothetical protein RID91_15075 [Azospirillaceae bacterium]
MTGWRFALSRRGRTGRRAVVAMALSATLLIGACAPLTQSRPPACDPFTARPHLEKDKADAIARGLLAERGLTVTRMVTTADIRRGDDRPFAIPPLGQDDDVLLGYASWADVAQCPQGRVVVDFAPSCRVKQVYTVYGCEIDGLPAS